MLWKIKGKENSRSINSDNSRKEKHSKNLFAFDLEKNTALKKYSYKWGQ